MTENKYYCDEELVKLYKEGNTALFDEICARYTPLIRSMTTMYFLVGCDKDDLEQEGLIGLFNAVTAYDFEKHGASSFKTFAYHCIKRKMTNAVLGASSRKHMALNNSVSIGSISEKEEGESISPEQDFIGNEDLLELISKIKKELSPFEIEVFDLLIDGLSYREIGEALGKKPKSVDNAIQRIKVKTKKFRRQ